jgi:uncharacterized membrane protein SpoIIM required for sporulation
MIIDLNKFISVEKPYWDELEKVLDLVEKKPEQGMSAERVKRFHYLYQRAAADLAKIMTFSAEPDIRQYLEQIVSRAYGEIYESRDTSSAWSPLKWFWHTFPQTFRIHIRKFWLALITMLIGCLLGGLLVAIDPSSKEFLLPFSHLHDDASQRVAKEESSSEDRLAGAKANFSSYLMTHNTRVSIFTLALGITYGVGTLIMLFYNGVILGAVFWDYIAAGETTFLLGWLLPHGAVEIPAILVAGQAGLVLASALIGWGRPLTLRMRFRAISDHLVTLIGGGAIMLIWAGIIESFFSQYHEPVIPYAVKIAFGMTEIILLILFWQRAGRSSPNGQATPDNL